MVFPTNNGIKLDIICKNVHPGPLDKTIHKNQLKMNQLKWNFPGKNTGVGCHALLQGIFLTQGSKLCLLCLLHYSRSFTTEPAGKPNNNILPTTQKMVKVEKIHVHPGTQSLVHGIYSVIIIDCFGYLLMQRQWLGQMF